jgi:hypothetical protein
LEIVMSDRRPQHLSGRPIRYPKIGVRSIWRIPDSGPVTPKLQPQEATANPIGFHAEICVRDDDE